METSSRNDAAELRKELRSDASTVTDSAKDRLQSEVDARKGTAADQAKAVSSALDKTAGELSDSPDWLRSALRQGADSIQRFANTIEHKDARQLTREVQQFARENPGTFLGACALAGFAAARVLRAGAEEPMTPGQGVSGSGSKDSYQPQSRISTFENPDYGGNPEVPQQLYQGERP
jgi:hypothetical protein